MSQMGRPPVDLYWLRDTISVNSPYLWETHWLHGSEPLNRVVRVSEVQPAALKVKNKKTQTHEPVLHLSVLAFYSPNPVSNHPKNVQYIYLISGLISVIDSLLRHHFWSKEGGKFAKVDTVPQTLLQFSGRRQVLLQAGFHPPKRTR